MAMTTDRKYLEWIRAFELNAVMGCSFSTNTTADEKVELAVRGSCAHATRLMCTHFPELRRVRGHYAGHEHWWCEAPDGSIVDPTAKQFTQGGIYVEHTGPEPVGKCIICGNYVWSMEFTSSACSQECLRELEMEYGQYKG